MEREHIGRPALSSSAGRHRWPEPSGYPVGQETAGRPATDRHFVQEGLRGIVDQRSLLTALRGEFNRSLQQLIQSRHGQPGLGSLRGAGWTRRCPSQRKLGACRRGNACGICCRWNHGQPSRTRRMDISTLCPPLCQPRRGAQQGSIGRSELPFRGGPENNCRRRLRHAPQRRWVSSCCQIAFILKGIG